MFFPISRQKCNIFTFLTITLTIFAVISKTWHMTGHKWWHFTVSRQWDLLQTVQDYLVCAEKQPWYVYTQNWWWPNMNFYPFATKYDMVSDLMSSPIVSSKWISINLNPILTVAWGVRIGFRIWLGQDRGWGSGKGWDQNCCAGQDRGSG